MLGQPSAALEKKGACTRGDLGRQHAPTRAELT